MSYALGAAWRPMTWSGIWKSLRAVQAATGEPVRWIFSDIEPDRFRWRSEISDDGGVSWRTEIEMRVRRTGS